MSRRADHLLGVFDGGDDPPAWATIGTINDTADPSALLHARALSEQRGVRWWLFLGGHEPPERPIGPHAQRVKAACDAAGLTPHLAAMSVGEEWYERLARGEFARLGATFPDAIPVVHDWLGKQQQAAFDVFGVPVVWLTTMVNNDRSRYGDAQWRPVPAGTHAVAIDAYVPDGHTFESHVAPVLAHAEATTALPLILVPQWFWMPGDALWGRRPTAEDAAKYQQWASGSRWIATVGYTFSSFPYDGIIGLSDLPDVLAVVAP